MSFGVVRAGVGVTVVVRGGGDGVGWVLGWWTWGGCGVLVVVRGWCGDGGRGAGGGVAWGGVVFSFRTPWRERCAHPRTLISFPVLPACLARATGHKRELITLR